MTAHYIPITDEHRPRDFSASYRRSRPRSIAAARRPRRHGGIALALAGAIALPAFAAPDDWHRFEIGDAGRGEVAMQPMPFEQAGNSFPGSAFYYLDSSEPARELGDGIHSDAEIASPGELPGVGPAALALRVDNSGIDRTRALQCLTAAIYYEAASEPDFGQRAVAQVVLNRVAHSAYPNTVCGVVYEGSERSTGCQFSFTCDGSLARRPVPLFWRRAEDTARAAVAGYVHAPAGLATHYHTVQIRPYWAPSLNYLATIGAHRFYRFKGRAGLSGAFRFAYRGGEPLLGVGGGEKFDALARANPDPVAVQASFETTYTAPAELPTGDVKLAPKPTYAREIQERGGDALYRGDNLPSAAGIKPEYINSGRWIVRPGT